MLPSILDVAQEYGLQFHSKTYGKKESLCKCPFCQEDSRPKKRKKYYLSLNTDDDVFKCWFCLKSGGVLDFEMQLSGKSFNEVKQKYFGKRKQPLHPAFELNPHQLDRIGWKEYKRRSFKSFQSKKEEVLQDWQDFVHKEMTKNFATFMCIAYLENQGARQNEMLIWFIKKCWESKIPNMYDQIQEAFLKPETTRRKWVTEGMVLGRMAWSTCIKVMDFDLENLFINIVFLEYFIKEKKTHSNNETCPKQSLA